MSSSPHRWRAAFVLIALAGTACTRSTRVERMAVVPMENLSANASLDWIGVAAPMVIHAQMSGSARTVVQVIPSDRDSAGVRATQILYGYYTVESGRLRMEATLRDVERAKTVWSRKAVGDLAAGPVPLLSTLIGELAGQARPFEAKPAALEAFGYSLLSRDAAQRLALMEKAYEADPAFTRAAIGLAQLRASGGDRDGAMRVLQAAIGKSRPGLEHAQIRKMMGTLEGNRGVVLAALEEAARSSPNDSDLTREIAETHLQSHRYAEAVGWLKKSIELEPGQPGYLNLLAYAQSYSRDFEGARQTMNRYRQMTPDDPNAYDSSGEIFWFAGKFAEAERYFQEAQQRQPQFLGGLEFSKAAFSRYLRGDQAGADQLFDRYLESRRALEDPTADVKQAHWLYLTGRKAEGKKLVAQIAQANTQSAAKAETLRALWLLEEGRQSEGFEAARSAMTKKHTPATLPAAAIVAFLAQPPASPEEWQARAGRLLTAQAAPRLKELIVCYALLLNKLYPAAVKSLDALLAVTPPAEVDEIRMLLGHALLETGDRTRAAALLANYPLPPQPGESMFASLYFPQFVDWRKAAGL